MQNIRFIIASGIDLQRRWRKQAEKFLSGQNKERGQVLLLVVLVMVIALTVGLSVATRSIINLRTSREEDNSQRALAAAEAGLELTLQSNREITTPVGLPETGATYTTRVVSPDEPNIFELNDGGVIKQNEGWDVWMTNFADDDTIFTLPAGGWSGRLTISWGANSADSCADPALEVIVLSIAPPAGAILNGTKSNVIVSRSAIDSCTTRTQGTTRNFSTVTGGGSSGLARSATITVSKGLIARVIPLLGDARRIRVEATPAGGQPDLPQQGLTVVATGFADTPESQQQTQRQVRAFRPHPRIPAELFQFVLLETDM